MEVNKNRRQIFGALSGAALGTVLFGKLQAAAYSRYSGNTGTGTSDNCKKGERAEGCPCKETWECQDGLICNESDRCSYPEPDPEPEPPCGHYACDCCKTGCADGLICVEGSCVPDTDEPEVEVCYRKRVVKARRFCRKKRRRGVKGARYTRKKCRRKKVAEFIRVCATN